MRIYNTLSHAIEEFKPISDVATMYTCGPTVYDYAHIGNLRSFVFEDVLRRALLANGFKVKHVMNITDVDDKTIKKSAGDKRQHHLITREYEERFFADLKSLNILKADQITRATDYIQDMVTLVQDLMNLGFAYKSEDGSIYFSISKFHDYGKLSGLDKEGLQAGARVKQDNYDKEDPSDFALWKAWNEEDGGIFWETALGKGRPGWHIECSAMSQKELGDTIDIHAGGIDLVFPHHENEIAQSEARSGKPFAKYWVHGEHLLVDNQKMSKSLQNFYTMRDLEERGFDPLDFRYLCLQAHYRSKLNFSWAALESAKNARTRLSRLADDLKTGSDDQNKDAKDEIYKAFLAKISDDLNTPEALAVLWEALRSNHLDDASKLRALKEADSTILGLDLFSSNKDNNVSDEVNELLAKRKEAKDLRDFKRADEIRDKIEAMGYSVEDRASGSVAVKR